MDYADQVTAEFPPTTTSLYMKIQILTITAGPILDLCVQSVMSQTFSDFDWLIHYERPLSLHPTPIINKSKNCANHRTTLKHLALHSRAEYFLWLDSDIAIPSNALEQFILQARPDNRILGGWYKTRDNRWVGGRWIADNTFFHFPEPSPSLVATDLVGLGCCFLSRRALEILPNEDGCDLKVWNPKGQESLLGECGIFGNRASEYGFPMFLVGDIVCKHSAECNP